MSTVNQIRVRLETPSVVWVLNGRRLIQIHWTAALAFCQSARQVVRDAELAAAGHAVEPTPEVSITVGGVVLSARREADMVLFLGNGRLLFDVPAEAAHQIWAATTGKAREAEELANAEKVALDAAILHRSGAPFGVAHAPVIRKEAAKLAQHDEKLRRYMKDGIKSAEVVPAPTVTQGTIEPDDQLRALMRRMTPADRTKLIATLKGHQGATI